MLGTENKDEFIGFIDDKASGKLESSADFAARAKPRKFPPEKLEEAKQFIAHMHERRNQFRGTKLEVRLKDQVIGWDIAEQPELRFEFANTGERNTLDVNGEDEEGELWLIRIQLDIVLHNDRCEETRKLANGYELTISCLAHEFDPGDIEHDNPARFSIVCKSEKHVVN